MQMILRSYMWIWLKLWRVLALIRYFVCAVTVILYLT
jgi:hypothetical protein